MNNLTQQAKALVFGLSMIPTLVWAVDFQRPDFIKEANSDILNEAGNEVYIWVVAAFVITVALFSIKPGFLAVMGKWEEAKENVVQIFYGVGVGMLMGGIVFAVMERLN